jgi:PAS domain-containing protein
MYKELFSIINLGIIYHDEKGKIIEMNSAAGQILGIKKDKYELLSELTADLNPVGKDYSQIQYNEFPSFVAVKSESIIKDSTIGVTNIKTGNKVWINVSVYPEFDSHTKEKTGFYTTFSDVTEQVKLIEELSRRNERLEEAQRLVHLGSWELDVRNDSVYWSKELYNLFYRDISLGPPNYSEFIFYIHPDDRYQVDELFQNALINGNPNNIDYRTNPDKGPIRYINTQYYCIIEGDQIFKVFGINFDITQRVKIETARRQREEQIVKAASIAKIGYWEYDVVKDMFSFNDLFYSIYRTTADKVGGYRMSSARYTDLFVHPEDVMVVGNEIRKAIETKEKNFSRRLVHRIMYEGGGIGLIEVIFFVVRNEAGKTISTYGINQDITESKRM